MRKIIFICLIICLFIITPCFASFAPMILNARAGGLGGAYVALSDDWGSLIYNPAGLSFIDKKTLGFNHLEMPESFTRVEFLGGVLPLKSFSLGLGLSTKSISSEELLFPFSENAFQVSIATNVMPNLSVGATGYFYMTTLDTGSAQGFGVDLGAIYLVNPNLSLGVALYNPISFLRWNTGTVESVERRDVVVGTLLKLDLVVPLKIVVDISLLEKPTFLNRVHIGSEINLLPILAIRGGYNGAKEGLTFGVGLSFANFNLDYALLYTKNLTNQHIISLSASF